jgi:hypothetical protein
VASSGGAEIARNWIRLNRSGGEGGGIGLVGTLGVTLTNNVVADNSATGLGAGVYVTGTQALWVSVMNAV